MNEYEGKMQNEQEGKMQNEQEGKMQNEQEGKMQNEQEGKMQNEQEMQDVECQNSMLIRRATCRMLAQYVKSEGKI